MALNYTPEDARALAHILTRIRPTWDHAATMRELQNAALNGATLADTATAALRAATNPAMKTPAAISFAEHWTAPHRATLTAPKCEDHPTFEAANCRCCWGDVKTGQRPADKIGIHHDPETAS